jgi:Mg-chelatase subunit ChlI
MSKLHLVFGGRVKDPQGLDFTDLDRIDLVGIFDNYADAEDAWRGKAQQTVDDAEMKYVVVHLHRLLEPEMDAQPTRADQRSNA